MAATDTDVLSATRILNAELIALVIEYHSVATSFCLVNRSTSLTLNLQEAASAAEFSSNAEVVHEAEKTGSW